MKKKYKCECLIIGQDTNHTKINVFIDTMHKFYKIYTYILMYSKSRYISLPTKVHIFEAMFFPVVIYRCESCTIKKAERLNIHWRDKCFWLCGSQLWKILEEMGISDHLTSLWETCMQKLQYFGSWKQRANSLEKTLKLGTIEGKRWQRMRWLDSITDSMGMRSEQIPRDTEGQRSLACCSPWGRKESDMT